MSDALDNLRRRRTERQAATLEQAQAQLRHAQAVAAAELELAEVDRRGSLSRPVEAPCATRGGGLSAGAIARSGLHVQPADSQPLVETRAPIDVLLRHRDQVLRQVLQAGALAPFGKAIHAVLTHALDAAESMKARARALTADRSERIRAAIRAEASALPLTHPMRDLTSIVRGRLSRRLDAHGLTCAPAMRTIRDELRTLKINAALSNRNDKSSA